MHVVYYTTVLRVLSGVVYPTIACYAQYHYALSLGDSSDNMYMHLYTHVVPAVVL